MKHNMVLALNSEHFVFSDKATSHTGNGSLGDFIPKREKQSPLNAWRTSAR